jgi:hypothetical protein
VNAVAAAKIGNLVVRFEGDREIHRTRLSQHNAQSAHFFRQTLQWRGMEIERDAGRRIPHKLGL